MRRLAVHILIPERDLVLVFTGSNFDDPLTYQPVSLLQQYIVKALR